MSDSEYIKKWSVEDDGTLTPASLSSMADLADDNVFIIVDEDSRKIFIWKGEKAPVRRKFISAKAAQQMRQEKYGMVYRIESLDPGLEGADFLAIFGAKPEEREVAAPTTSVPEISAPKPAPAPKVVKETEVVVTAPIKTITPTTLEEVSTKLKDLEMPDNMEREIIIIGNLVFSVIKEHLALFSKDVVKLEPMDDLPSGIFPASDYQVRLFIEDGRVIFTELLRKKTRSEREEFIEDMRKSLQDLSKMGI